MKQIKILFFVIFLISCDKVLTMENLITDRSVKDSSIDYYISPSHLPGLLSTEYYKITAYLSQQDSYLILFSHFNSFKTEDGVKLKIKRKENDLIITASVHNSTWKSLLEKKDYFSKNSSKINFTIEIKNGIPEGAKIAIWENFTIETTTNTKKELKVLTTETLLTDTSNINFYRYGKGLNWGIKIFHSRLVKGARISSPLL
ncbi:MAG: hypothetical protein OXC37_04470 [Bdellovibrionaceae bacterium]|nr:hypothetical protein [Pseudobdellovibrionaceae bacterium]